MEVNGMGSRELLLSFMKQSVKDAAVEEYKKATKKNTEVTIEEQAFLGSDW